jgi:hypothetical protein
VRWALMRRSRARFAWRCEIVQWFRWRAELRAGELLTKMKANGERRVQGQSHVDRDDMIPALDDLGISRDQSSQWQKLGELSQRAFVAWWNANVTPGHEGGKKHLVAGSQQGPIPADDVTHATGEKLGKKTPCCGITTGSNPRRRCDAREGDQSREQTNKVVTV